MVGRHWELRRTNTKKGQTKRISQRALKETSVGSGKKKGHESQKIAA